MIAASCRSGQMGAGAKVKIISSCLMLLVEALVAGSEC